MQVVTYSCLSETWSGTKAGQDQLLEWLNPEKRIFAGNGRYAAKTLTLVLALHPFPQTGGVEVITLILNKSVCALPRRQFFACLA